MCIYELFDENFVGYLSALGDDVSDYARIVDLVVFLEYLCGQTVEHEFVEGSHNVVLNFK